MNHPEKRYLAETWVYWTEKVNDRETFLLTTTTSLGLLFVIVATAGWTDIGVRTGDHWNIIWRSRAIFQAQNPFTVEWLWYDPPLRYVPWLVAYTVVGVEHAEHLGFAVTTLFGIVFLPATLVLYAYVAGSLRAATYIAPTTPVLFASELTDLPWNDNWHYITPLPAVILALVAMEVDLTSEGFDVRRSVVVGLAVGIVGLQQTLYGALVALTLGVAYLFRQRWRSLLVATTTGGLCAVYLPLYFTLLDGSHTSHAAAYLSTRSILSGPAFFQSFFLLPKLGVVMSLVALIVALNRYLELPNTLLACTLVFPLVYFVAGLALSSNWIQGLTYYLIQIALPVGALTVISDRFPNPSHPVITGILLVGSVIAFVALQARIDALFPAVG